MFEIEYDVICANCQEKGFNFGYSFKTIRYKNEPILDLPHEHLNGATLIFSFDNTKHVLSSMENAHGKIGSNSKFCLINSKKGRIIQRFTYGYYPSIENTNEFIYFFIDIYQPENQPYFLYSLSILNKTSKPIENLNVFNLFDFDIYGDEHYNTDNLGFDSLHNVLYQFDGDVGLKKGIVAGLGTCFNKEKPDEIPGIHKKYKIYFEGASPEDFAEKIHTFDLQHNCDEQSIKTLPESGDYAIGLQWKPREGSLLIQPEEYLSFPIFIVAGNGLNELIKHTHLARSYLKKKYKSILRAVRLENRLEVDEKLQKLSFSDKTWCK